MAAPLQEPEAQVLKLGAAGHALQVELMRVWRQTRRQGKRGMMIFCAEKRTLRSNSPRYSQPLKRLRGCEPELGDVLAARRRCGLMRGARATGISV